MLCGEQGIRDKIVREATKCKNVPGSNTPELCQRRIWLKYSSTVPEVNIAHYTPKFVMGEYGSNTPQLC